MDAQNHRVFKVNGQNVLIRGGGWASDMFLRFMPGRLRTEFQYVKDMNLNAIRLEGQLQPDYFFDLADEYGILIMAGWCCCSHWEHWQHRNDYKEGPVWDKEDYDIAAKSQADQIRRLRNHPSVLVWLNGSDNPPPADVEQMYIDILKKYQWPNPFISSATAKKAEFSGVTGVKMEGPYEWVPASYWLLDKEAGGAHGFATEISPGPAVPPLESLQRMIPKEHLWPIDEYWNYHAGGGQFKNIKVFTDALNSRYGAAKDVRDYALKSQLMTYEGQRAMFEAYAGRPDKLLEALFSDRNSLYFGFLVRAAQDALGPEPGLAMLRDVAAEHGSGGGGHLHLRCQPDRRGRQPRLLGQQVDQDR